MADGSRAAHGREHITKAELARAVDNGSRAFHGSVVALFAIKARRGEVSVERISSRLNLTPAEIVQWIESPKGWDLNRVSDFCVAMAVDPRIIVRSISDKIPDVSRAIDLLKGALAYQKTSVADPLSLLIQMAVFALGGTFEGQP